MPSARQRRVCRRHLTALLRPVCGPRSGAVAQALIDRFGSLRETLYAPPRQLLRIVEGDMGVVAHLRAIRAANIWQLRTELEARPLLDSYDAVFRYLQFAQGHARREHVRALYLDAQNRLIGDDVVQSGTVDEAAIHVREIVQGALEAGAAGLILAHNHPSGDVTPSATDRQATRNLAAAARLMLITFHDHLIVGRTQVFSFRRAGLL